MRTALRGLPRAAARSTGPCRTRACSSTATTATTDAPAAATESTTDLSKSRLRFAPSPTGFLHLGGLRTALFNHLLARKWGGKWILRIEDTDKTRLVDGAVDALRRDLEWAGLDYDEGVGVGGSKGPYTQSERLDMYRHYAHELVEQGKAYECFCTPDDLNKVLGEVQKKGGRGSYDGRCRHLSRDDVQQRKQAGHKYTIRFKAKSEKGTIPPDLVYGATQPMVTSVGADDFIMLKSDGGATYHLASVIDDHFMEITHVLRGEEWLPSVTKHHQIYKAFGWEPPQFAHLPLLINPDGSKLSKRTGDVRVGDYVTRGYEPEAMVNFLALMGWDHFTALQNVLKEQGVDDYLSPKMDKGDRGNSLYEILSMDQLIKAIDIKLINHRPSAVDMSKLDWINKMTLRRKAGRLGEDGHYIGTERSATQDQDGFDALVKRFQDDLRAEPTLAGSELVEDVDFVTKVFELELPRTTILNQMPQNTNFFFLEPDYDSDASQQMFKKFSPLEYFETLQMMIKELEKAGIRDWDKVKPSAVWDAIDLSLYKLGGGKKTKITLPMRHALTGRKAGPSVAEIMAILGPYRSMERLKSGLGRARAIVQSRAETEKEQQ